MRIVILGAGQVGSFLAKNLSSEHEIVIIEKDKPTVERLRELLDVLIIEGDGDNPQILKEAEIDKCDIMLAVSGDDKTNILASSWSASVGVPKIIVRIRDRNYLDYPKILERPKVYIVNPGSIMAEKIISLISSPYAWKTETLAMGKIKLLKLKVEETSPIVGKMLKDIGPAKAWIFVALSKNGEIMIPTGESRLDAGDYIFALGKPDVLSKLKELFNVEDTPVKSVVIVGCGRLGLGVAKALSERGIKVKLIDSDPERALVAAEQMHNVLVFKGDATDTETLKEAGVESADYFISLTGDDEENVLSALLAKNLGAKRTTVLYTKPDYIDVIEAIGVDRAISVRLSVANEILSLLHIGGVAQVALVEEGRAEVIEVDITQKSKILGKALKDIDFPEGSIVGIVLRHNEVVIPRGDYVPEIDDKVIIFTLPEAFKKVENIVGQ